MFKFPVTDKLLPTAMLPNADMSPELLKLMDLNAPVVFDSNAAPLEST